MGSSEMDTSAKGSKTPALQQVYFCCNLLISVLFEVWIHKLLVFVILLCCLCHLDQEQAPTTSGAAVYPEWAGFQVIIELCSVVVWRIWIEFGGFLFNLDNRHILQFHHPDSFILQWHQVPKLILACGELRYHFMLTSCFVWFHFSNNSIL